jgi:enolase 1/2/3
LPTNLFTITKVRARSILDSRGNPTVQVDVTTRGGFGRFSVPSGASKGQYEAVELRDNVKAKFHGMGVSKAVGNVEKILGPAILGTDSRNQEEIDRRLNKLDGTKDKSHLGANAILGVSMAVARAQADTKRVPFYKGLQARRKPILPVPLMNILNGAKHAGNALSFQEFLIIPSGFPKFKDAIRSGSEVYHTLGRILKERYGPNATNVGDEGGYAPPLDKVDKALEVVNEAVQESGYSAGKEVSLGIDAAADSFYNPDKNIYTPDGKVHTREQLFDFYLDLTEKFHLKSIEDPFQDNDFNAFAKLTRRIGSRTQIIADDLFVTNKSRIERGVRIGAGNALLAKLNQAGTLTETISAVETARSAGYGIVISHRSGETEDTSIADVSVGFASGQIKTGAMARGERTAKYNRLLEIEEELGSKARYYGRDFLQRHRD